MPIVFPTHKSKKVINDFDSKRTQQAKGVSFFNNVKSIYWALNLIFYLNGDNLLTTI
jgi:hypothetical protein